MSVFQRFSFSVFESVSEPMKIAIIGLGYVGLPLSLQFARNGVNVVGIDIDPSKIDGNRYRGSHRSRQGQAVRLHAVVWPA